MKKEEKDLLLKDLCARLPYGTMVYAQNAVDWYDSEICTQVLSDVINEDYIVKPYLYPMDSLPEEKVHEFYCRFVDSDIPFDDFVADYWNTNSLHKVLTVIDDVESIMDWYNENHVDCRRLIYRDLAIDATGLNIY